MKNTAFTLEINTAYCMRAGIEYRVDHTQLQHYIYILNVKCRTAWTAKLSEE